MKWPINFLLIGVQVIVLFFIILNFFSVVSYKYIPVTGYSIIFFSLVIILFRKRKEPIN